MTIGTRLFTRWRGRKVGTDRFGNTYYEERRARPGMRQRRWVIYAHEAEASEVPPEWHAWLHYTTDAPLPEDKRFLAAGAPAQPDGNPGRIPSARPRARGRPPCPRHRRL